MQAPCVSAQAGSPPNLERVGATADLGKAPERWGHGVGGCALGGRAAACPRGPVGRAGKRLWGYPCQRGQQKLSRRDALCHAVRRQAAKQSWALRLNAGRPDPAGTGCSRDSASP